MVLLWVVVALAVVFVIAAVVIGREAGRLRGEAPRPVFDLEEATDWVAANLPFEVAAELTHDDVRRILGWNLEFFRSRGVTSNGDDPDIGRTHVVVAGSETVAFVVDQAREADCTYTAPQVLAVLDAQLAYFEAIGALGPAPDDGAPPRK
ncbi:MAG TPA: hypothetical protein VMN58_01885 [Acidimicrobiales bacterium]|nr:hypothetical protein [Acidimicrobiales bacterium]